MHSSLYLSTAVLAATPAHCLKRKTWHGPPNRLNSTDLIFCLDNLAADIVDADHYNDAGWPCANSHFQIGGSLALGLKASRTRRECHDESMLAAQRGEAWFKCKCQKGLAHSWLTWSPLGWNSCKNKNGAPCKVVDGWWDKEGDGGAACRAEGLCPITTEIFLQTVQTTVTVETTREVVLTSVSGKMSSDDVLRSHTTSGEVETVTSISTTETLSWQKPIDLPIVIGQTPSPSSSARPSSQSSSDDSETLIIVTMTSGQTPSTTGSAKPTSASSKSSTSSSSLTTTSPLPSTSSTKPTTTSQTPTTSFNSITPTTSFNSITSTIIDGKTYTYLKEPEATSTTSSSSRTPSPPPPPQPITSVIGGVTITFVPVMQNPSTMGKK